MFYEVDSFLRRNKDWFYHNTIAKLLLNEMGLNESKMIKII